MNSCGSFTVLWLTNEKVRKRKSNLEEFSCLFGPDINIFSLLTLKEIFCLIDEKMEKEKKKLRSCGVVCFLLINSCEGDW